MRSAVRRSDALTPTLLGLFFLSVYLLTGSNDLKHNGDTLLRYQTTQALVDQHHAWIDHPKSLDTRVARGVGGHLYTFYAPGQAILMAPLYVAGKVVAHHLGLPYEVTTLYATRSLDLILGTLLAVLFYLLASSLGYSRRSAVGLTLIFGLATVAWPDAQSGLEQTQVNVFLLAAVYSAWQFVRHDCRSRRWLAYAGSAIGWAVLTRYDALLYLPIIVAFPIWMRSQASQRPKLAADLAVYGLALAPWLLAVALWDYGRFGSVFRTGLHEQTLGEPPWLGLANLLVSPGKGLIWYLPLVFVLTWALKPFFRKRAPLATFLTVLVLIPIAFYSNVQYWHGDPSWGPRYLYTAVPYLLLPVGEVFIAWRFLGKVARVTFLGLVATSLVIQISAISVTQWRFWYRLEAIQQQSVGAAGWFGTPFHWGAQHYQYYWTVRQSPILIQLDNVYQVARLSLGDERYRLTVKPDPLVSNPADNYAINTFAFWWTDDRHPLLGPRTRDTMAVALLGCAALSLGLLLAQMRGSGATRGRRRSTIDLPSFDSVAG